MQATIDNASKNATSNLGFKESSIPSALRTLALGAVVAAGTVAAESKAKGAYVDSIPTSEPTMRTQGLTYAGRVVWIEGSDVNHLPYFTQGLLLPDGKRVLASAHVLPSGTGISTLKKAGNGPNYLTARGNEVEIQSWVKNTNYDLAVITLKDSLPTIPLAPGLSFFAAPTPETNYTIAGYGPIADPSTSSHYTGDIRSFGMVSSSTPSSQFGYPDDLYFYLSSVQQNGRPYAISGDSSSFLFNDQYQVVGTAKAGADHALFANKFTDSGVLQFVNVPEPTVLGAVAMVGVLTLRRRREE